MDNEQNNVNPPMPEAPSGEKSSFGPLLGIIIIIIILVVGAFYFWSSRLPSGNENTDLSALESELGDVVNMEAELDTSELDAIEAELNAELNSL